MFRCANISFLDTWFWPHMNDGSKTARASAVQHQGIVSFGVAKKILYLNG